MISRNDLLEYAGPDRKTIRVLWIDAAQTAAYVYDVQAHSAEAELARMSVLQADLASGRARLLPDDVFQHLGKVWVGGQQLRISHADAMPPESAKHTPPKAAPGKAPARKVPGMDKPLRKPGKFNKFK